MAWVTPKTDWAPANGVADTDFNRIEGNEVELKTLTDNLSTALAAMLENARKVRNGGLG